MSAVAGLFTGAGAIDLVMLVMAAELALLAWVGREPGTIAVALLPGACLAFALRGALTGSSWVWIALPLAISFPLHLADLRARGWLGRRVPSVRSGAIADRDAATR